jgi:hypothetical protein
VPFDTAEQERQPHVLGHGLPRKDRVPLEDEAESSIHATDVLSVDGNASRRDRDEPGDQAQERRFTAAGRPDDRDELAAAKVDRDVLNRGELSILTRDGEPLRDSLEDDGTGPTVAGHEGGL